MRLGARLGAAVSAHADNGPMASNQGRARAVPTPRSTVRRETLPLIVGPFLCKLDTKDETHLNWRKCALQIYIN